MRLFKVGILIIVSLICARCGTEGMFSNSVNLNPPRGIVVTTVATDPSTGPGIATFYDMNGRNPVVLYDYYQTVTGYPTGAVYDGNNGVIIAVDGTDMIQRIDLLTLVVSTFSSSSSITAAPLRQITRSTADGSVYIVESSTATIEKLDSLGQRTGNPFISTTTGSCVLATPYGITYIPTTQYIAVISMAAAGKLQIYDKNGTCISQVTAAPFATGTPTGIAYHAPSNKLIVSFSTGNNLYAVNLDGSSPVLIYSNSSIINTPRGLAVDSAGYIYVSSTGTDTVEKLSFDGTTATRATPGPFLGPNAYTQNVTSIAVVE